MPAGPRDSAALITGSALRHERLGYLIQQRFPGLLKAWWMYAPSPKPTPDPPARVPRGQTLRARWTGARRRIAEAVAGKLKLRRGTADRATIEQAMFGQDIAAGRAAATLQPTRVADVHGEQVVAGMAQLRPYFLLVLGGPLLLPAVLQHVRGAALNQHAGHSPELRGAHTIRAALYHRRLDWVAATVHLLEPHADAGSILRRSTATLHADDCVEHCFLASVATGTKLLLATLEEALHADVLPHYPQPRFGKTMLSWQAKRQGSWIQRDISRGWLGAALQHAREW